MEQFDNETLTTDNGLMQIKPELSRDEQLAFIDTLRNIQSQQNQEIRDATHALGTDTTPQYGGLNGANSYWLNRYQTPQTEARIATLRSAAQTSALNQALSNYLAREQERYNQAYRKASKRSRSSGSGGSGTTTTTTADGKVEETANDKKLSVDSGATTAPIKGRSTTSYVDQDGNWIVQDTDTGEVLYKNGVKLKNANLIEKVRGAVNYQTLKANGAFGGL